MGKQGRRRARSAAATRALGTSRFRMDHTAGTGEEERWAAALAKAEGAEGAAAPAETPSAPDRDQLTGGDSPRRVTLDGAAPTAGAEPAGGAAPAAGAEPADGAAPAAGAEPAERLNAAVTGERERVLEVQRLCADYGIDAEAQARYIGGGADVPTILREHWNARVAEQDRQDGQAGGHFGRVTQEANQTRELRLSRGMQDSMIERCGSDVVAMVQKFEREDLGEATHRVDGAEFRGLRLAQLARMALEGGGVRVGEVPDAAIAGLLFQRAAAADMARFAPGGDPAQMALASRQLAGLDSGRVTFGDGGGGMAGAQGRDQFPNILRDAMHRVIRATYAGSAESGRFVWRAMCSIGAASDFRPQHHTFIGGLPDFAAKNEAGEYETVQIGDGEHGQIVAVEKGMKIKITRETIVNDDLGGIMATVSAMGPVGNRTVENLLFVEVNANAGAGRVSGAGGAALGASETQPGAVSEKVIHDAWVRLRKQKSIGDHGYLDLMGDTVLCDDEARALFEVINRSPLELTAIASLEVSGTAVGGTSEGAGGPARYGMRGKMSRILSSPRIGGVTRWYLWDSMAAPWRASFLYGRDEPYLQQVTPWTLEGTAFLGALDVGVAMLSKRGVIFGTGAA